MRPWLHRKITSWRQRQRQRLPSQGKVAMSRQKKQSIGTVSVMAPIRPINTAKSDDHLHNRQRDAIDNLDASRYQRKDPRSQKQMTQQHRAHILLIRVLWQALTICGRKSPIQSSAKALMRSHELLMWMATNTCGRHHGFWHQYFWP